MRHIHKSTGVVLVLVLGLSIGVIHGFYASGMTARVHHLTGEELCHGPHLLEEVEADSIGDVLLLEYKARITRGNTTIEMVKPDGSIYYERFDDGPIFRQHSVRIDDEDRLGEWKFRLRCDRAELFYDINFGFDDDE